MTYETAIRLNLQFANGAECRINARHDFSGHSQYNPAHGVMKAGLFGAKDHIMICGHTHSSGYGIIKDPASGITQHAIQVATYKIYDRYAKEKGFRDQNISPAVLTVIDPRKKDTDVGFVTVFHDIDIGVEYLEFLRAGQAI